jgi:hypothetical protein
MRILAIDGRTFTPDRLRDAVKLSPSAPGPLKLLVGSGDRFTTLVVDYHGGARYPQLERAPGEDLLAPILERRGR